MPTPQLTPISLNTSSGLASHNGSRAHNPDCPMAPAGSVDEPIAPKPTPNSSTVNELVRTTDSPVSVDDTLPESEARTNSAHGGLSSPEPISSLVDESPRLVRHYSNHNHGQRDIDYLHRPLPQSLFRPNSTSSILRSGARFTGIQRSEKQKYEVVVDVQHVDLAESFMCGYLRIHALTEEHPTLTTYFEGEMIGSKHSFVTKHPEWGASEKVDFQHWDKFRAWKPYQKDAKRANFRINNWAQKENIWMRWKEYFLVPDHTVKDLTGASFDGFYYICFNQSSGSITGTYYHLRCEKGQQLELTPADPTGFDLGYEFR